MWQKLRSQPTVQKLVASYDQLPAREQRALKILTVALALFLVYMLAWRPAQQFNAEARERLESARELVALIQQNQPRLQAVAGQRQQSAQSPITDTRSLLSTVTSSAGQKGLDLQRFEPSGENRVRVWLDDVGFQALAGWLETLAAEYGIEVEQASVDRAESPGQVTARLTLTN